MKFLILLLVIAVVLWLARSKRPPLPCADRAAPPTPDTMVACAQCGLHLPRSDALPGRGGMFCGEAHRALYEQSHPQA
jgi:uncharacterized protein